MFLEGDSFTERKFVPHKCILLKIKKKKEIIINLLKNFTGEYN